MQYLIDELARIRALIFIATDIELSIKINQGACIYDEAAKTRSPK
jgi:hypothetical protein